MLFEVVLFILFLIAVCLGIRHCVRRRHRNARANAGLPAFRQTMSERRRQRQQPSAASAPTVPPPRPHPPPHRRTAVDTQQEPPRASAPTERSECQIRNQLFSRSLEDGGDTVREMEIIMAAANDRHDADADSNILVRSYRAATDNVLSAMRKPECSICLGNYEAGDVVCWAKTDECDHLYHDECIIEWLKTHNDCPLCRANLMGTES